MTLPIIYGAPRLGPCVEGVSKFIGVGLNNSDHAAEANMPIPSEPIIFHKATSSIIGANDDVMLPKTPRSWIGRSSWASSLARQRVMLKSAMR